MAELFCTGVLVILGTVLEEDRASIGRNSFGLQEDGRKRSGLFGASNWGRGEDVVGRVG